MTKTAESSAHVSDLTWDRLLAGDLEPSLVARAERHASACAMCAARRDLLEDDRRRFQAAPPTLMAGGASEPAAELEIRRPGPGPAPWWRRGLRPLWLAPGLAAALAVALLVPRWWARVGAEDDGSSPAGARRKGGFAVTVFAGREGRAVALGAGDPVYPGDRLQLTYSAERAGHLAVLSIDGQGRVTVYFPADASTTWPAAAGEGIPLPRSTELDDVLGEERLFTVFCDLPRPLLPLVEGLEARGDLAPAPPGCEVRRFSLDKRAPPAGEPR